MYTFTVSDAILIYHDLKKIDKLHYPEGYNDLQELIKTILKRMERIKLKDHQFNKFLKELLRGFRARGQEEAIDSEPIMKQDFTRTMERLQAFKTYLQTEYKL